MEMASLKKAVFIPPASRRFGEGKVVESVSLAGWEVGWRDTEFKVIVTSVCQFTGLLDAIGTDLYSGLKDTLESLNGISSPMRRVKPKISSTRSPLTCLRLGTLS
jgi:hypothetical protein